jgi:hypothetical protein
MRGSGPSRSGCPTCGLHGSLPKPTASRARSRRVASPLTINPSSTPSPSGQSKAWRDLDRRGRPGLCRQATSRHHLARRPIRRHQLCHGLPPDRRSDLGTTIPRANRAERGKRLAKAVACDDGQDRHSATHADTRSTRATDRFRNGRPQSGGLYLPWPGGLRLASLSGFNNRRNFDNRARTSSCSLAMRKAAQSVGRTKSERMRKRYNE